MAKMKASKRVILMVQSGLGVVWTVVFLLDALGCAPFSALNRWITKAEGGFRPGALTVLLLVSAFLTALGALSFAVAFCAGKTRGARLLALRDNGGDEILLTQDTLDELARSAVGEPEGVFEINVTAAYSDGKAAVTAEISVSSAINIPETTRAIQERVRKQLEDVSGIPVSSVDIKVLSLRVEDKSTALTDDSAQSPASETDETDSDTNGDTEE